MPGPWPFGSGRVVREDWNSSPVGEQAPPEARGPLIREGFALRGSKQYFSGSDRVIASRRSPCFELRFIFLVLVLVANAAAEESKECVHYSDN